MKFLFQIIALTFLITSNQYLLGNSISIVPNEKVKSLIKKSTEYDNPLSALQYLNQAYQLIYDIEDSVEASLYFNLGIAHGKLYHIDSSKYFLNQALNLTEKPAWSLLKIGVLNALGNVARIENNNEVAMRHFHTALDMAKEVNEPKYITWNAKLLGNLAGIYFDLAEFKTALKYSKESLLIAKLIDNSQSIAYAYSQLGYLYSELDSVQMALESGNQSVVYFQKANDSIGLIYQYFSLGVGYFNVDNLDKSKFNFLLSKQLAEKFGEAETYIGCLNRLGEIELNLGNLISAKNYAREALKYGEKNQLITHLKGTYDLLYEIALIQNEYRNALTFRNAYYALNDSINNQETLASINELNAKYESEKKEREIIELNHQNRLVNTSLDINRKVKNILIGLAIIIILFAIYIYRIQKQKFRLNEALLSNEIDGLRIKVSTLIIDPKELTQSFIELNKKMVNPISQREYEVLQLTFSEKTNIEIADQLFISVNTVKTHLKNLYVKLGVSNRKEAIEKILLTQK